MDTSKIIRSICLFTDSPSFKNSNTLDRLENLLIEKNFTIQTKRICSKTHDISSLEKTFNPNKYYLSIGTVPLNKVKSLLATFYASKNTSFNVDLSQVSISMEYVDMLFELIKNKPDKTFLFAFVFNNSLSSPFFPAASFEKNGFSIGLQPIDLSVGCQSLGEWFERMKTIWDEIYSLFANDPLFLGIDSSTATLLGSNGSLVHFIQRLGYNFSESVKTDIYLQITDFIKKENPKALGLCGLMIPCLEDEYLAREYEKGNFSVERNLFLSLHSGLGVDVYPIGIDEKKEKVLQILKLSKGLSQKYQKPLSARFVSDGKAKVGERTNFLNGFLADVLIRPL